ncbi:MAG: hypothetical protein K2L62_04840 [Muribaculaceae bacterium]|nr:hypothetical protein [Muribaculaceae bacterium]MDE6628415.1 hypothetical protein [Muribaculaceae bacterium]
MIQKKVIDTIYRKFRNRPASPDELNIPLLFEQLPEETQIEVDGTDLVINSVDAMSPFHRIPVSHIHAIIEFDEAVAIVLHSAIVFLSKDTGAMSVHLKDMKLGIIDRLRGMMTAFTAPFLLSAVS